MGARFLSQALHIKMSSRRKFLIPAALVLIGVSLWNILPDYLDKRTSSQTYEDLREDYTEVPAGDDTEQKKDWWLTDVLIRFDELKEQNPDIVAWIRSDDPGSTGIDYPVLYSGDNEKYLRRDLYGEDHIAGSIFLEGLNQPDFTDYYTIIYGHNMNDGSMFGGLKKYKEKEFWEENQYFTLYTEDMAYRYQVFACQNAVNGGDVYKIGYEPGKECMDRHQLLTQFFQMVSGMTEEEAEKDACRVEHTISRTAMDGITNFLIQGDVYDRSYSNMDLSLFFDPGDYRMAMDIYEIERRSPRILAKEWDLFEPYACLEVKDGRSVFRLRQKKAGNRISLWYRRNNRWKQAARENGEFLLESTLFDYTVNARFPVTEGTATAETLCSGHGGNLIRKRHTAGKIASGLVGREFHTDKR